MSELYQDLMIQQQEENERKRRILLEQEEKLAAEILRFVYFVIFSRAVGRILSPHLGRVLPVRDSSIWRTPDDATKTSRNKRRFVASLTRVMN